MTSLNIRAATYDYEPNTHTLHIVGTDEDNQIVTVRIRDVFPAQLLADIEAARKIGRPLFDWHGNGFQPEDSS